MSTKPKKLCAHLSILTRRQKDAVDKTTDLHRRTTNATIMTGRIRTYTPKAEDAQIPPSESQPVQLRALDALEQFGEAMSDIINTVGTREVTNMVAKADVVLDGKVLIKDAPPTFLLFLEAKLRDTRTFVEKMLELDPAQTWTFDAGQGVYKSEKIIKHTTAKVQDTVVVVQATDKFPAQVKDVVKDVVVGHWETTQLSGGIPRSDKEAILRRITRLEEAVKIAREQANTAEVVSVEVGQSLMDHLFGPTIRPAAT